MKTAILILLTLTLATAIAFGGYLLGVRETEKKFHGMVLNDWFILHEGYPIVYREGYIRLPKTERDSLYINAINNIKQP